jgi:hypothetical protein
VKERLFRGDVFEHERSRREDFDPISLSVLWYLRL